MGSPHNLGQRLVVVVALGAALSVLATYIVARYIEGPVWFGYTPLTRSNSSSGPSLKAAIVWLMTIVVWGLASVRILGLPYPPSETTGAIRHGD
jgi:heme/copper-type cytochrome/quinol oxidase subunit 1